MRSRYVLICTTAFLLTVEDTGHFRNFKSRTIGRVKLDKPGRYAPTVKLKKKAAAAVLDLRLVALKPAAERNPPLTPRK
jgi:hypothetical protein